MSPPVSVFDCDQTPPIDQPSISTPLVGSNRTSIKPCRRTIVPHRAQVNIDSNLGLFTYLLILFELFFLRNPSEASVVSESFSRSTSSTSSRDVYLLSFTAISIQNQRVFGRQFLGRFEYQQSSRNYRLNRRHTRRVVSEDDGTKAVLAHQTLVCSCWLASNLRSMSHRQFHLFSRC